MIEIRIESTMAAKANEALEWWEEKRPDTWEGSLPDMSLEEIYRFFNRVDQSDCDRLDGINYKLPSLSMGDFVTVNGETYLVEAIGFKAVS